VKHWKEVDPQEVDMPESVKTPGRTWTEYPETEVEDAVNIPEIETEGEVQVLTGSDAIEAAENRFFDAVRPGENRLTALHAQLLDSPILVKCSGTGRVRLVHDTDSSVCSHVLVETETSTELDLEQVFRGSKRFQSSILEVYPAKNSTITHRCLDVSESELSYTARKAISRRDSEVRWHDACFGPELSRRRTETALKGDGSSVEKEFLWYPSGDQHFDIELRARHIGHGTTCSMDSQAVVDDQARSVYKGVQKVEETAEDTSSFQDEDVLTLSGDTEVDASPKLIIENPDVEASHAASAGGVDTDVMHYMRSRGVKRETARRLVVSGFYEPLLEGWNQDFADSVRKEISAKNTA
jgi:ABC-type transport system involved in Fe-S cluster assembly, permease component